MSSRFGTKTRRLARVAVLVPCRPPAGWVHVVAEVAAVARHVVQKDERLKELVA